MLDRLASPHLRARTFRANPAYELCALADLGDGERTALAGLADDRSLHGVLRARAGDRGVKAIDRDTAAVFAALRRPGPVPAEAAAAMGAEADDILARLVLDGVLEVEHRGDFASGPAAHALLGDRPAPIGEGPLARLSIAALRHAQDLGLAPAALSLRLYRYHHLPISPRWRRALPDEDALATALDLQPGGRTRRALDAGFRAVDADDGRAWWIWSSTRRADRGGHGFKLYLSPQPEHLREALAAAVSVLVERRAPRWKLGRSLAGVLRPDKLVAYFPRLDELRAVAAAIGQRLAGVPAHGVPFTGALDGDGLLSWGMDPPRSERGLAGDGASWRLWLTSRLAVALAAARGAGAAALEPWRYALARLRLEGIDPASWTPAARLWEVAS